MKIKSSFHNQ